jgi:hypothetical protein
MYLAESSRLAARGTAMLLLAPPATFTWDASAQPPVSLERLAVAARLAPRDPLAHCEYGKALAKSNQLSKARTERYRNATAFLFTMQKLDSKP